MIFHNNVGICLHLYGHTVSSKCVIFLRTVWRGLMEVNQCKHWTNKASQRDHNTNQERKPTWWSGKYSRCCVFFRTQRTKRMTGLVSLLCCHSTLGRSTRSQVLPAAFMGNVYSEEKCIKDSKRCNMVFRCVAAFELVLLPALCLLVTSMPAQPLAHLHGWWLRKCKLSWWVMTCYHNINF